MSSLKTKGKWSVGGATMQDMAYNLLRYGELIAIMEREPQRCGLHGFVIE